MAGIRWVSGSPDSLRMAIESFGNRAAMAAIEALEEAVEEGKRGVRNRILDAPPTARSHSRGHNARWETGAMYFDVDKDIQGEGTERVVGSFGWLNYASEDEAKIKAQELGTSRITEMNALYYGYVAAEAALRRALAAKGFKVS